MDKPIFYKAKLVKVKNPMVEAYGLEKAAQLKANGQTLGYRMQSNTHPINDDCICEVCGGNKWLFDPFNKQGKTKPYIVCIGCNFITHL